MSTPKSKTKGIQDQPCKWDWDFSSCTKEEVRWCDVYEHLREDKVFIEEVKIMRARNIWSERAMVRFSDRRYAELAMNLCLLFPEFPEMPFLSINSEERTARCRKLNEQRQNGILQITTTPHYYSRAP